MKSLLAVSLVTVLLGFSNGAMALEWSTPEALRAFGKQGDTVRGSKKARAKKSSFSTKIKKNDTRQTDKQQPDNTQHYVFKGDYLDTISGSTTPEQQEKEVKRAEDKIWQNELGVREAEQSQHLRQRDEQEQPQKYFITKGVMQQNQRSGYMTKDIYGNLVNSNTSYLTKDAYGNFVNSNTLYPTIDAFGNYVNSNTSYQTKDAYGHFVNSDR